MNLTSIAYLIEAGRPSLNAANHVSTYMPRRTAIHILKIEKLNYLRSRIEFARSLNQISGGAKVPITSRNDHGFWRRGFGAHR
jgi:hypothetical protein